MPPEPLVPEVWTPPLPPYCRAVTPTVPLVEMPVTEVTVAEPPAPPFPAPLASPPFPPVALAETLMVLFAALLAAALAVALPPIPPLAPLEPLPPAPPVAAGPKLIVPPVLEIVASGGGVATRSGGTAGTRFRAAGSTGGHLERRSGWRR